jgi:hypothetical protein
MRYPNHTPPNRADFAESAPAQHGFGICEHPCLDCEDAAGHAPLYGATESYPDALWRSESLMDELCHECYSGTVMLLIYGTSAAISCAVLGYLWGRFGGTLQTMFWTLQNLWF